MTEFSYQLYSSRNFPPLADTLKMVADLGYSQVEGFGALFADANTVNALEAGLKDTGLTMPTGHFGLDMCEDTPDTVLDIAKRLGVKAVIVPFIQPQDRPNDSAGWTRYAASLAAAGKPFQDAGLHFGYHNHDFEYAVTPEGDVPLDLIMAGSDDLQLEFDVAWAVRANADPLDTITKHGPRILCAHLKDIAAPGTCEDEDGWADVGHGTMAWGTYMTALRAAGCTYFITEHDNPSDHHRFASRALATAKSL